MRARQERMRCRTPKDAAPLARAVGLALALGMAAMAQGLRTAPIEHWGDVTTRVSVDSAGVQANDASYTESAQVISGDGRYITFDSGASNLVPGDTNGAADVFVHDRLTGETRRASVDSWGGQGDHASSCPAISADGRCVAFSSYATNLVPGDGNGQHDVFVHDLESGETSLVSVDSNGMQADRASVRPTISADGRYVAFSSYATNLVPGDTNYCCDAFVHDRMTGETIRVSVSSSGQQGDLDTGIFYASISGDGRYVAFPSLATNLVSGDTNGRSDIFVHDLQTHETTRVSVSSSGAEADQGSTSTSISGDGRHVAFASGATNLVPGDTNDWTDVFVHDRLTGQTTRASLSWTGTETDHSATQPAISADGRYVTFIGYNLAPERSHGWDTFVHDRLTLETTCASPSYVDVFPNYSSDYYPSISADGRCVAFETVGTGLVPGDTYRDYEVFVRSQQLTLDTDPAVVAPGQTLVLTVYKGCVYNPASIWVVAVNGAPTLWPVAIGKFAGNGNFAVSGVVPPGLSGQSIALRGYGFGMTYRGNVKGTRAPLAQTNDVTVSFK
ncbi:MAG: calcium-binding protein [Planctomycetota bacterium]